MPISTEIIYLDATDSTMNVAKDIWKSRDGKINTPIVVIARQQENGRGRMGKKWVSTEKGGLYYSLLIKSPNFGWDDIERIQLEVAAITSQVINTVSGVQTTVKHPNDVMLNGLKVAGILLESSSNGTAKKPDYVIVGIGINLNQNTFNGPLETIAISIKQVTNKSTLEKTITDPLTQKITALISPTN